jgi:bifunctional DNA-binding transcriptional regulator/antitoxin component of YhaV-PrlF toxin-antitoxin module
MAQRGDKNRLLLQQFEVKGYKNLTRTIRFGSLGRINVIHGKNNVGKSNLLQAMDLYFRLLGTLRDFPRADAEIADVVNWDFPAVSDLEEWGHPSDEIFNFTEPKPIEMTGAFALTARQREQFGLERSKSSVELGIQLLVKNGGLGVGTKMGGVPEPVLRSLLDHLSTVRLLQAKRISNRFALIGVNRHVLGDTSVAPSLHVVPQEVRDKLFDAKESREATMVRRWELFVEAMRQFEPILGSGRFDTAFDRRSNQADLVFDKGNVRVPVGLLGSGVQQIAALLGQLLLTPATLVGIEEPELNLRYTLQKQLLGAFQKIVTSEYGPEQLFLSSHSPAFETEDDFFAMEIEDGVPVLERRPRELARDYTAMRDAEDDYSRMHARRPEPVSYVSSEGLVMLPEDVREALDVENGGGVSFIPNRETDRFEIWCLDDVEQQLFGAGDEANDA